MPNFQSEMDKDSKSLIKQLHEENYDILLPDGRKFDIPVEGSLGLLALGYKGVIAWKKKKSQAKKQ